MSRHQGQGQEGQDGDEVRADRQAAGGQGQGARPGRARGVRLRVQPRAGLPLRRQTRVTSRPSLLQRVSFRPLQLG